MQVSTKPAHPAESEGHQALRITWALTQPYFSSSKSVIAWVLVIALGVLNALEVGCNVLLADWNKRFFNAAQELNREHFTHELLIFPGLVGILLAAYAIENYCGQILRLRWRQWLTDKCLTLWMEGQAYYRLNWAEATTDNPDQRITEDVSGFVDKSVSLAVNFFNAVLGLISFTVILWTASGPLSLTLPVVGAIEIPGYLVWGAWGYAALGTFVVHRVGQVIVDLDVAQERLEANFRYALVRIRENAESIALYGGERVERATLDQRFDGLLGNWRQLITRRVALSGTTTVYSNLATIVPWLMLAERFFSGLMKMGDVMQAAQAFGQVRSNLSVVVNNYSNLASWRATVRRLAGFAMALGDTGAAARPAADGTASLYKFRQALLSGDSGSDLPAGIQMHETSEPHLRVIDVETCSPTGERLGSVTSFTVSRGERILLGGPSGSGKTTLLRAIAGIWPHGAGRIECPPVRRLILSQRPYLPLGTLRSILCYPQLATDFADPAVREILRDVGLGRLASHLDQETDWSHVLSLGEQQRIGFARALLTKPDFLVLDEATSALDEQAETTLYGLLAERLADSIVLSVGHRSSLMPLHHRRVHIGHRGDAAA